VKTLAIVIRGIFSEKYVIMDGLSLKTVARDGSCYIIPDCLIFQPSTTIAGQVKSERSISVLYIFNHHHYPLKFQRDLC
jgi:hypothetical protein